MPTTDADIQGVLIYEKDANGLVLMGSYRGVPPTTADEFAKGCVIHDLLNGRTFYNTGTSAAPSWETPDATVEQAVTATADGLTTGVIDDETTFATITSGNAAHIVTLPTAKVGKVVRGYVGANGCELRTTASSGITINNVDSDGTNEAAIPATTLIKLTCVSSTAWILEATTELGAVVTAIVPDTA